MTNCFVFGDHRIVLYKDAFIGLTPTLFLQCHGLERIASFFERYIDNSVTRCRTCSSIPGAESIDLFAMFKQSQNFQL
jgi:hypothetical protein